MVTDKPGGTIKGVPKGLIPGSQFLKENPSNYSSDDLLGTNCDIGACSKVGNNWAWCNSAGGQTPYHCMGKYAGITGSKYTNIHTTLNPQGWMWTEWFDNDTGNIFIPLLSIAHVIFLQIWSSLTLSPKPSQRPEATSIHGPTLSALVSRKNLLWVSQGSLARLQQFPWTSLPRKAVLLLKQVATLGRKISK
jgi:hypothetical protein